MGPALTPNRWDSVHTCPTAHVPLSSRFPHSRLGWVFGRSRDAQLVETDQAWISQAPARSQCWDEAACLVRWGPGLGQVVKATQEELLSRRLRRLFFMSLKTCSANWTKTGDGGVSLEEL